MAHGIEVVSYDYTIRLTEDAMKRAIDNAVKGEDYESALALAHVTGMSATDAQQFVTTKASQFAQEKHKQINEAAQQRYQNELDRRRNVEQMKVDEALDDEEFYNEETNESPVHEVVVENESPQVVDIEN